VQHIHSYLHNSLFKSLL